MTSEQKNQLIADVESRIVMPKGSADLRCYRRQYALVDGSGAYEGKAILVGAFERGKDITPGIAWEESTDALPGITDQGCHTLGVWHLIDNKTRKIEVGCYPTFDGAPPSQDKAAAQFHRINKEAGDCPR